MKTAAWDIEIAKQIPDGTRDWKDIRPLGISCAALHLFDGNGISDIRLFHSPAIASGQPYPQQMTLYDLGLMVEALSMADRNGYRIITWNGLSFDFDVLAEEVGPNLRQKVIDLALGHIDLGFQMVCERGFMCGLDTACRGMGVQGKLDGMHGDLAPIMWSGCPDPFQADSLTKNLGEAPGTRGAQDLVLRYVAQDVAATTNLIHAVDAQHRLIWTAKSGRKSEWRVGNLLTAQEAMFLPPADTSWMTTPRSREDYYKWMDSAKASS